MRVLVHAKQREETIAAWEDFLLASGGLFSTLEQAAKGRPESEAWFAQKKKERTNDELLKYLRWARNAEEHGIEPIVKLASSSIELRSLGAEVTLTSTGKGWVATDCVGDVAFRHDIVVLADVYNERSDAWCKLPTKHFGTNINSWYPAEIAVVAFPYFEKIMEEARAL